MSGDGSLKNFSKVDSMREEKTAKSNQFAHFSIDERRRRRFERSGRIMKFEQQSKRNTERYFEFTTFPERV